MKIRGKIALVVAFGVLAVACKKDVKVSVECNLGDGVACSLASLQGNGKIASACWDVVIECANNTRIRGNGCQDVQPEGKATRVIPMEKLSNAVACDKAIGMSVENIRVFERE